MSESLTKLVQPAGLVPATVLVLLNLAFIYPSAKDVGVGKRFAGLDEEWQLVVVVLVILALGYLLLNAANAITDTLAGLTWRGSLLYTLLSSWQRWRRSRLEKPWSAPPSKRATSRSLELATRFPPPNYVKPTKVGNALSAAQFVVYDRYGIDIASVWGAMESSSKVKESPALTAVKEEKATLDLLANLILVLVAFAAEGLVFFSAREQWGAALASLLALPAAYLAYHVAVLTAFRWGDAVAVVFDLHRGDVREELALTETSDPRGERAFWRRASRLYLPGAAAPSSETPLAAIVSASPTLSVQSVSTAIASKIVARDDFYLLRYIDYVFIVSRSGEGFAASDFIVDDPRVGRIVDAPPAVSSRSVSAEAERIDYQGRTSLRWRVRGLRPGGSLTLNYRLPLWTLRVDPKAPEPIFADRAGELHIRFPAGLGSTVTVALEAFAPMGSEPELFVGTERHEFVHAGQTFAFGPHPLSASNPGWTVKVPE